MIKNVMKRQVFFIQLSFLFCFIFKKTSFSLPMLFVLVEKSQVKLSEAAVRRCSLIQMFLKISQCSQKTPVSESLSNKAGSLKACIFIKKEILTQVFSCEYCEIFVEHFLFIILLCDDRIIWTSLGTKSTFYQNRESIVISYLFLYQNFQ